MAGALVLTSGWARGALAAPGDLDLAFGAGGIAQIDLGGVETVSGAVLDSADRLVVVGSRDGDGFVARVGTTGVLDTTFGTDHDGDGTPDGYTLIDQGGNEYLESVALDSQGRIYAAGVTDNTFVGTTLSFAVRFLPDGALDGSYASSGAFPAGGGTNLCDDVDAEALVLDAADNLFVFGTVTYVGQNAEPALTVLDGAGSFVGSRCHGIGVAGTGATRAHAIALEPSTGAPLWVGDVDNDGYVARGLALGTAIDPSYAVGGLATISHLVVGGAVGPAAVVDVSAVAVDDDPASAYYDMPVVVGNTIGKMLVVRLDTSGGLDANFNNGKGFRKIDFGTTAWGRAVAIDGNGRILAAGKSSGAEILLARVRRNGRLDGGFGVGGKVTTATPLGGTLAVSQVVVTSTGRIVVVGSGTFPGDLLVAGYLGS